MHASNINIIPSHKLDKLKWDDCIEKSLNGLIYATSVYLDHMADDWEVMILNDHEFVMPLPCRKKFGIRYIYPPAFTQQLGIFSAKPVDANVVDVFLKNISSAFRYCELNLNYANPVRHYKDVRRKNYLLDLHSDYQSLQKNYSRSAKRNMAKAVEEITVTEDADADEIIHIHRNRFKDKIGANANDYERFSSLVHTLTKKDECITIAAKDKHNNTIAGSIYFRYKNRLTFILNGNTTESLNVGATHLLKDFFIKKFAGSSYILDFEGSDFPNFATFYEQFGAKTIEYYSSLIINKLPPPLRWLKANPTSS